MNSLNQEIRLLQSFLDLLEKHFGKDLEVVLHDFSKKKTNSIIDIRNGEVTHRVIGDGADRHGLEINPGVKIDGNTFREIIYTDDNKILKGSTITIRDDNDNVLGCLCINQDISKALEFSDYIKDNFGTTDNENMTMFKDIGNLLDDLIKEAIVKVGKSVNSMDKDDRLSFLRYLDERGTFLISKSGPKVCEVLKISKFTLYKYLEAIRSDENNQNGQEAEPL